jgi:hypothetical protein
MNTQEIFDAWGRDELDTVKAIVLLKARVIDNNTFIQKNSYYRDDMFRPNGSYLDLDSEWYEYNNVLNRLDEAELDNAKIEGFIESVTEKLGTVKNIELRIMWKGSTADLARLYNEMFKAGLIEIKGRDFSKHFCLKDGKDLPLDFLENKGTNQKDNSPKQEIMKIQSQIRGMKPESVE